MYTIGINTFLFTSPFTNESVKWFSKFAEWGFDTVEIGLEEPWNVDPQLVKKALTDANLGCKTVCAAMGPDRDFRGDEEQQQTAMTYLKALLDFMEIIGAEMLVGPLYSSVGRAEATPKEVYKEQEKTVVGHLKELAAYAAGKGLKIALEPLNRFETDFINTADQAIHLADLVGNDAVRLHLDTFHMNIEEKFQAEAIRKAGSRLELLHSCGCDRGIPGNDHIDWASIRQALKDIDFKGQLVIESFTPEVKAIAKAAAIWRDIEPSGEDIAVKGLAFLKTV
ncbi:sugar phosphate isomerase/epimerase family protein [Larkinella humicola]|uniref:Sugar phosphate isomerase/epimerase n=1 Tax=Larkinella humicola TaxID=2607654 RepID=A0A5N1JEQ2_9BACT|nr:sugar phosphate isomerase/epimerase [Larkinella humicola]KAA9353851.1 sugar phosphate isomerase/epimerase [Larkinella humicola]